ncbi:MAG: hypothetical protein IJB47_07900 [Oscillospiraceae bacterium]|nr:hypothetical protein [Oscillospiraceae bacterium]
MNTRKKSILLLVSLVLLLALAVGGTLALLIADTESVVNTFTPGSTDVTIEETFNQPYETKENVSIKNAGDVPVYIRVAIIPTWEDGDGNPVGIAAGLSDLTIDWGATGGNEMEETPGNGWEKGKDGFWYYTSPVSAGNSTNNLITSATVITSNGYKMNLQILAQSIQAQPDEAVEQAWTNAKVTVDANNGTLTVANKVTNN